MLRNSQEILSTQSCNFLFRDDGISAEAIEELSNGELDNEDHDSERTITMIHENTDIPDELAFDFIKSKTDNSETVNDCSSEVDEIKETPDQKSCISELLLNLLHDDSVKNLLAYVNMPRVIVTIEKLKELKGETCREMENDKVCGSIMTYNSNEKGSVFILSWSCPRGHAGIWRS